MSNLDDIFRLPIQGPKCWRARTDIPKDVTNYIASVEAFMEEHQKVPVWEYFSQKLESMGYPISSPSLRHHYRRKCSCQR